jgi:4-hydroxy-L-threonine phosphate dehydrogenase PdxA
VSEQVDNFRQQLRSKIDDADKRLKGLEANLKASGEKAKSDAKTYVASLDSQMKAQQAKLQTAQANMKAWVQEKQKVTSDKIAEWKTQMRVTELTRYADLSEQYAASATQVASSAIDEAEKAIVDAMVARINADSAQGKSAAKSA